MKVKRPLPYRRRVAADVAWDLTRLVGGRPPRGSLDGPTSRLLTDLAVHHGVAVHLRRNLDALGIALPGESRNHLDEVARSVAMQHLSARGAMAWLATNLDDVPWFVIKGPALSYGVYEHRGSRTFGDLDVVVPPRVLPETLTRLARAGGRVLDRDWNHLIAARAGELSVASPYGILIDLHWRLHNDVALRRRRPVPMDELLERTRTIAVSGRSFRTLSPTDTLAHLAVHTCGSGGDRLAWFLDVDQVVRDGSWNEENLGSVLAQHGAELAAELVLDRAHRLFDTPLPATGARRNPGVALWRGVAAATGRFDGPPRTRGGPSIDRLVIRSVRAGPRDSAIALGHKARRLARRGQRTLLNASPGRARLDDLLDAVTAAGEDW